MSSLSILQQKTKLPKELMNLILKKMKQQFLKEEKSNLVKEAMHLYR